VGIKNNKAPRYNAALCILETNLYLVMTACAKSNSKVINSFMKKYFFHK
tara:strand:- start:4458 stop:4604 length:147 start_codon:yes stop_codon:yes gene_type:complete